MGFFFFFLVTLDLIILDQFYQFCSIIIGLLCFWGLLPPICHRGKGSHQFLRPRVAGAHTMFKRGTFSVRASNECMVFNTVFNSICYIKFPTHPFFSHLRIIIHKSKTAILSFQREKIITYLFRKLTKISKKLFQDRHPRNIWSVRNV